MDENLKSQPLYKQIENTLITQIQTGELLPGDKIAPERVLAKRYQVNRSTVVHALDELVAAGWIVRKQGSGTHVAPGRFGSRQFVFNQWRQFLSGPYLKEDPYITAIRKLKEENSSIDLYTGDLPNDLIPDFVFPSFSWQEIRQEEHQLTNLGYGPLKAELILFLQKELPIKGNDQELLITSGATQASILLMTLLLSAGDVLATEESSFLFSLPLFSSLQVQLVGIAQDAEGLSPTALEVAIQSKNIRLLYLTPNHQNPTGKTLSLKRRKEILALCQKYRLPIIEDDVFHELSFAKNLPALKSLAPDQVIYIGSLSKIFGASIKIGWLYAPKNMIKSLAIAKERMDNNTELFPQLLAYHALSSAVYQTQQQKLTQELALRSHHFASLLEDFQEDWHFTPIQGGLYYWLTWKHQKLSRKQWSDFLKEGLLVAPSFLFSNDSQSVRINYTRLSSDQYAEFRERFKRITQAWKTLEI